MEPASLFRHLYYQYLSHPREDRDLFRALARSKPITILELGLGDGDRTERLLASALRFAGTRRLRYVGVDLFEGRAADAPGMSLRDAHRRFSGGAVNVKLVPGDPFSGLMRIANSLQCVDWMLIAHDQDASSMQRAWRYVPRMLQEQSQVWTQQVSTQLPRPIWRRLELAEVQQRAEDSRRGDRTAA